MVMPIMNFPVYDPVGDTIDRGMSTSKDINSLIAQQLQNELMKETMPYMIEQQKQAAKMAKFYGDDPLLKAPGDAGMIATYVKLAEMLGDGQPDQTNMYGNGAGYSAGVSDDTGGLNLGDVYGYQRGDLLTDLPPITGYSTQEDYTREMPTLGGYGSSQQMGAVPQQQRAQGYQQPRQMQGAQQPRPQGYQQPGMRGAQQQMPGGQLQRAPQSMQGVMGAFDPKNMLINRMMYTLMDEGQKKRYEAEATLPVELLKKQLETEMQFGKETGVYEKNLQTKAKADVLDEYNNITRSAVNSEIALDEFYDNYKKASSFAKGPAGARLSPFVSDHMAEAKRQLNSLGILIAPMMAQGMELTDKSRDLILKGKVDINAPEDAVQKAYEEVKLLTRRQAESSDFFDYLMKNEDLTAQKMENLWTRYNKKYPFNKSEDYIDDEGNKRYRPGVNLNKWQEFLKEENIGLNKNISNQLNYSAMSMEEIDAKLADYERRRGK